MDADTNLPEMVFLSQNYPNPFNPITQFEYGIPEFSYVDISLYDLNGRKIKSLINSYHQAGYFTMSISANNLNSGVYILQLINNNKIISKKLTVVK